MDVLTLILILNAIGSNKVQSMLNLMNANSEQFLLGVYHLNHGMKLESSESSTYRGIDSLDHCLLLCLLQKDTCKGLSYGAEEGLCLLQDRCGLGEERYGWITVFISTNFMKATHKRGYPYPCAHTEPESTEPWWVVDLGTDYRVSGVRVWNRQDCCGELLTNYSIEVSSSFTGDALVGSWDRCTSFTGIPQGRSETLCCTAIVQGRYLKLQMHGSGKTLTLCEIEVFGGLDAKEDCSCQVLARGTLPFKI